MLRVAADSHPQQTRPARARDMANAPRQAVGSPVRVTPTSRRRTGDLPAAEGQALTQVLPKDGFSSPMTLMVLPQALTGMWMGTWMRLPEPTPGEYAATP